MGPVYEIDQIFNWVQINQFFTLILTSRVIFTTVVPWNLTLASQKRNLGDVNINSYCQFHGFVAWWYFVKALGQVLFKHQLDIICWLGITPPLKQSIPKIRDSYLNSMLKVRHAVVGCKTKNKKSEIITQNILNKSIFYLWSCTGVTDFYKPFPLGHWPYN